MILVSREARKTEDVARITIYAETTDDAQTFTKCYALCLCPAAVFRTRCAAF